MRKNEPMAGGVFVAIGAIIGVVAGKMTKTNVAGYVAAFPIPEVVMGINAFTRGMRSVNPKAEVKVVWVNSWFDPGRESEAANTLAAQGATGTLADLWDRAAETLQAAAPASTVKIARARPLVTAAVPKTLVEPSLLTLTRSRRVFLGPLGFMSRRSVRLRCLRGRNGWSIS